MPLFVFRLRSIWDGLHVMALKVRLQSLHTLWKGFPVVASYVAWRADQVLCGSCTLDIDSDDVNLSPSKSGGIGNSKYVSNWNCPCPYIA